MMVLSDVHRNRDVAIGQRALFALLERGLVYACSVCGDLGETVYHPDGDATDGENGLMLVLDAILPLLGPT